MGVFMTMIAQVCEFNFCLCRVLLARIHVLLSFSSILYSQAYKYTFFFFLGRKYTFFYPYACAPAAPPPSPTG